jgi:hypothetical protein
VDGKSNGGFAAVGFTNLYQNAVIAKAYPEAIYLFYESCLTPIKNQTTIIVTI